MTAWFTGRKTTSRVPVTVALALALLAGPQARAAGEPARPAAPSGVTFYGPLAELPAGHWAYAALEDLIRAGLVVEYAPGLFDDERTISRYEAAMLLVDAFRRAGAVGSAPEGAARLKVLLPDRLLAGAGADAATGRHLREILLSLGQELSEELKVLGFAVEGAGKAGAQGPATASPLEIRPSASLSLHAGDRSPDGGSTPGTQGTSKSAGAPAGKLPSTGQTAGGGTSRAEVTSSDAAGSGESAGDIGDATAGAGEAPAAAPWRAPAQGASPGGVPGLPVLQGTAVTPSYHLGVRSVIPGRWDVGGQLDLSGGDSSEVGAVVVGPMPDRWLWARVGRVWTPLNSAFALGGDREALTLQGIEARIVGNQTRTGLVLAQQTFPDGLAGEGEKGRAIAVLDGSLALSRQVVVGGAIIRGGESPTGLLQLDEGSTVTAIVGRYTPLPWLSLTGEYAQNLWAMPLIAAAMRLGATLDFGGVKVGARVDSVHPGFQPALGTLEPGAEVGVDASVKLGDVQLRAGAGRRQPSASQESERVSPELITSLGVQVGSLPGTTVRADYEWISVDDLSEGRRPDRARTRVSVDWGGQGAQLQMGLEWGADPAGSQASGNRLEASAAVSYQLNPYAAVMLGYRLIDFGESTPARAADATARLTLRF